MIKRYVDALASDTLAIFLFHGVISENPYSIRNYTRKHIDAQYFGTLLDALLAKGSPVSMDDVIHAHETQGSLPSYPFVISFDDGFENNLSVAAPLLEQRQIPAIFYITSDFVENNTMSWIDRIEMSLESTEKGRLVLPWSDRPIPFDDDLSKIEVLNLVRAEAKQRYDTNFDELVELIAEQLGHEAITSGDSQVDLKLNWDQVRELSCHPLFTVGGHTHTHPIMSFLNVDALEREVKLCLSLIETHTQVLPHHFSYPEGLAHHYSEKVIAVLKRHGISCCPTAIDGVNQEGANLFHLKRIMVV